MDILLEAKKRFYGHPAIRIISIPHRQTKAAVKDANRKLIRVGTELSAIGGKLSAKILPQKSTDEASHDCTDPCGNSEVHARHISRDYGDLPTANSPTPMSPVSERAPSTTPLSPISPFPSSRSVASLSSEQTDTNASTESASAATGSVTLGGVGKRRFTSAVRTIITANRAMNGIPISPDGSSPAPAPRRTRTKPGQDSVAVGEQAQTRPTTLAPRVSRVATLVPALKSLQVAQLFQPHTALVRHLQFSPNGEFLATCR